MTKEEIISALSALAEWAKKAKDKVKDSESEAQAVLDQELLADAVKRFMEILEPDPIDFSEFVRTISQSLVNAQERLDQESIRYLSAIADKPQILPSIFRVPKLEASMKFAMKVEKGRALNLLFYSKRDQTQSQNEQSIDFEVVSVPAPAGASQQLLEAGPALDLVLEKTVRAQVLDALTHATPDSTSDPLLKAAADNQLAPRLVILAFTGKVGQAQRFLLFHSTSESNKSVGLWLLTLPVGVKPKLKTIYKFTTTNSPTEVILRNLILELGDRLEKLFGD